MNIGKELHDYIYKFPTKYDVGFLPEELQEVIDKFPQMDMKKWDDAMMGNTCQMREGKLVIYHCDVLVAVRCGLEKRDQTLMEWD